MIIHLRKSVGVRFEMGFFTKTVACRDNGALGAKQTVTFVQAT